MGSNRDAVQLGALTGTTPEMVPVRRRASRPGAALNVEQAVTEDLGVFLRASLNDGGKKAYEFTEINRSVAVGLSHKGTRWNHPDNVVGLAFVDNHLSRAAQTYFSAGGIGILIGDGALRYRPEQIVETYYSAVLGKGFTGTFDYQFISNPAYNRDRGPVSIYSARIHYEF